MRGQAPGGGWLKHMILLYKILRVRPVIGDLPSIVIAHDVDAFGIGADGIGNVETALAALLCLGNEAVHLAAIDVGGRVSSSVRATAVQILGIIVRLDALSSLWVVDANRRHAVLHRNAVRSWIGAEVGIERAILLHDHNDVFDLMDTTIAALILILVCATACRQQRADQQTGEHGCRERAEAPVHMVFPLSHSYSLYGEKIRDDKVFAAYTVACISQGRLKGR